MRKGRRAAKSLQKCGSGLDRPRPGSQLSEKLQKLLPTHSAPMYLILSVHMHRIGWPWHILSVSIPCFSKVTHLTQAPTTLATRLIATRRGSSTWRISSSCSSLIRLLCVGDGSRGQLKLQTPRARRRPADQADHRDLLRTFSIGWGYGP